MHKDVERLIALAKERGFLTLSQRELILNKAQELGDDIIEVEFFLEDLKIEEVTPSDYSHLTINPNDQATTYSVQTNNLRQNVAESREVPEAKKKGKWIWIVIIAVIAAVVAILVLSVFSKNSNSENLIYNYFDNTNYTNWYDELTKYDNGFSMYMSELSSGKPIDDVDNEYRWLLVLQNNIENAAMTGQLSPEQEYRFNQIQEKYTNQLIMLGIGSGVMSLFNQLLN
jgi:hypothetical protein